MCVTEIAILCVCMWMWAWEGRVDCVRRLPLVVGEEKCVCMYIAVFSVLGMKCVLGCRQIILFELFAGHFR